MPDKIQNHQPNMSVNRADRKNILAKRVRNLTRRWLNRPLPPKIAHRIAQYRSELNALNK